MTFNFVQSQMVERLGWVLVHSFWQFTLVALIAAMASVIARRWTAGARYSVLLILMGFMVCAPVATGIWITVNSRDIDVIAAANFEEIGAEPVALPAESRVSSDVRPSADSIVGKTNPSTSTSGEVDSANEPAPQQAFLQRFAVTLPDLLRPWLGMMVVCWCLGVAGFGMRPLVGWFAVRRLQRSGVCAVGERAQLLLQRLVEKMGLALSVRLLESTLVQTPVVIGCLRPMILLPVSLVASMPVGQLESILVHELAHIRRNDYFVNLLQTLCETLFFYHPAIWWLSARIRIEREHCCDDAALAICGDKIEYGRALLSLEEMRGAASALALGARSGTLVSRVKRLLYGEPAPPTVADRGIWAICMTAAVLFFALLWSAGGKPSMASHHEPSAQDVAVYQKGGEPVKGLELRVISVSTTSDEQKPSMAAPIVSKFAEPKNITLVAELKNVSDKSIKLVGVRYGEGVSAPSIGKSNTSRFGPILFEYEFRTREGMPLEPPSVLAMGNPFLELSSARAEILAPGEKMICALTPVATRHDAAHWLPTGEYSLTVNYVGVNEATQADINKHWPKLGFTEIWNGKVSSNAIPISIADQPKLDLAWGPLTKGLQAAVELRDSDTYRPPGAPAAPRNEFPLGAAVASYVHVKNVSDKTITFWSEEFRQGDEISLTDSAGKVTHPPVPFFSGWPILQKWTLKPGEVAVLYSNIGSGLVASTKTRGRGGPTLAPEAISKSGRYKVQIELNFGGVQTKDAKGNPIPGPDDYTGKLVTGETPFTIRERTLFDDPPKFTAKIDLKSKTGGAVAGGFVEVREVGGEELFRGEVKGKTVELKSVDGMKPCYVTVRANGFEEQTFYDIALVDGAPAAVELTKSQPTTLKLVSVDGKPVSSAKVRYFVRSKAKANGGPYPMKGIEGDVWAISAPDGSVVLDTLQKFDPLDAKLGDNTYWFYIEPPAGLAGRFIGPIIAGDDLGEVSIGNPITVRGVIRGTPEELDNFSAEWDQPEKISGPAAEKAWDYAVSRNLETTREGDKLTFELSGLRPGRLRFVSNFKKDKNGAGHEYSKRIVGPNDVVLEIEIAESRSDVVISSTKP
jgi:beta-lactamase regulating signal transducer with metallopeptidase domain